MKNGKRCDACLNLAAVLAGPSNVEHGFFHRRAIDFARDGAADGLLVAPGALRTAIVQWLTRKLEWPLIH